MAGLPKVPDRTLRAAYDRALTAGPDETAQIGPGGRYTVAESHDRLLRIAAGIVLRRGGR